MKIGILGAADIAFRRFLPALKQCAEMEYAGVASRTPEKAKQFVDTFGGKAYSSYEALLADESVDAVYVPLPPALHYEWGRRTLLAGKHLLMEKPFTTGLAETEELLSLAEERGLAVHENYMFLYHGQLARVRKVIADGALGEIRLYRMSFGFPKRSGDDFRYRKALGGGALLDCGGYPVRLALELLGEDVKVTQAKLVQPAGYEVDLFGSAVLENPAGICAQLSFGMDNAYQCRLEVWGSKATLIASRIFTAGPEFAPSFILRDSSGEETLSLEADNSFLRSLQAFQEKTAGTAASDASSIRRQAELIDAVRRG